MPAGTLETPASATVSQSDRLAGATIGRYTIASRLGRGGQGVVYLAQDRTLNRPVALKFLAPVLADDDCARRRFLREAQTASAVQHPNICTIYGLETTDDGQPFIVMAYCEGVTLRRALNDGVLTIADSIDIAAQIAEGLSAAHAQGVVHRDVKPGNVMLTDQGVKLLDFGLARFIDSSQITATGSVLGTASYMSPEQIRCEPSEPRSDVWSLGIILYEMLTGAPPFSGSQPDAICYAITHHRIPPSTMGVPWPLRGIVFRSLSRNPARRPSADALARALRSLQLPSQVLSTRLSTVVESAGAGCRRRRSRSTASTNSSKSNTSASAASSRANAARIRPARLSARPAIQARAVVV